MICAPGTALRYNTQKKQNIYVEENIMAQVTKETMIGELLNINIDAATPVLLGIGMHCLGCPASQTETIEEAAAVHGVDADELVRTLNEKLAEASAE